MPGHHHGGREVVGGDARTAEAVEGHAAGPHVVAGVECGHAAQVPALFAHLGAGAPDDIVHVRGVEPIPLCERFQHGRSKVLGVEVRQRTLSWLSDAARRAASVDDQCLGHGPIPSGCRGWTDPSAPEASGSRLGKRRQHQRQLRRPRAGGATPVPSHIRGAMPTIGGSRGGVDIPV